MKPLILISNDDSVNAKGIQALIEMVQPYGEIVVVAPDRPQSGKSHSLTSDAPLRLNKLKEEKDLIIYSCSGTPADCIKLAMSKVVNRKPDLLVSGINHGSNSSISVLYSGTMAAAIEGTLYEVPSIGFSLCDESSDADFSASIIYGRQIVEFVLEKGLPEGVTLNVNIPKLSLDKIKGIKVCKQNKGRWVEEFDERVDPYGRTYYWMRGKYENLEPNTAETDEAYLTEGYISVVPTQSDLTAYTSLNNYINKK